MPEYPDVVTYLAALSPRVEGEPLLGLLLKSPFVVRTVDPPIRSLVGKRVVGLSRLGKRLVFHFEDELFLVLHLMIAGRLYWKDPHTRSAGRSTLATFEFPQGTLVLTEASTKKRASLHLVRGREGLAAFDRGGLEVMDVSLEVSERLRLENHTLKRALTDPTLFSAIGNAYSDEILHRARLSPLKLSQSLDDEETERLYRACREVLSEWAARLQAELAGAFPEKVTAFRKEMAVHGRYRLPCPVCGKPVQRIVYAENETNYCPTCQTGGKLLADRSLSRLLKADWPRTPDELEERRAGVARPP
jgi:formamidopyrimidine-DNA glycosylase